MLPILRKAARYYGVRYVIYPLETTGLAGYFVKVRP